MFYIKLNLPVYEYHGWRFDMTRWQAKYPNEYMLWVNARYEDMGSKLVFTELVMVYEGTTVATNRLSRDYTTLVPSFSTYIVYDCMSDEDRAVIEAYGFVIQKGKLLGYQRKVNIYYTSSTDCVSITRDVYTSTATTGCSPASQQVADYVIQLSSMLSGGGEWIGVRWDGSYGRVKDTHYSQAIEPIVKNRRYTQESAWVPYREIWAIAAGSYALLLYTPELELPQGYRLPKNEGKSV